MKVYKKGEPPVKPKPKPEPVQPTEPEQPEGNNRVWEIFANEKLIVDWFGQFIEHISKEISTRIWKISCHTTSVQLLQVHVTILAFHNSWLIHHFSEPDEAEDKDGDSSSNGGKGDPDDVTDPDVEPKDDDSNCFETKNEDFPWWSGDLGKAIKIGRVKVRAGKIKGK